MLGTVDAILVNFALLIACICVVSLTYLRLDTIESIPHRSLRWYLCVATSLLLLGHALPVSGVALLSLHAIPVALITRRAGLRWGLLAAVPVTAYRLYLGGPSAVPDTVQLLLVALLTGATTRVVVANARQLFRVWWVPLSIFAPAHLTTFLAFHLHNQPLQGALPAYLLGVGLSALGMSAAHFITQTRIDAIRHAAMLEQLAFLDTLTGVFNRRQFNHDVEHLEGQAFLLLLDLDHFKRVNDTYGHDAGDEVLIAVARALREHVRPSDRVYRLGGEEFVVLLHPCEAAHASGVAERARAGVERDAAGMAGLPGEVLTVSGGLIEVIGEKRDILRRADELLYEAKSSGRNRVMSSAITSNASFPDGLVFTPVPVR